MSALPVCLSHFYPDGHLSHSLSLCITYMILTNHMKYMKPTMLPFYVLPSINVFDQPTTMHGRVRSISIEYRYIVFYIYIYIHLQCLRGCLLVLCGWEGRRGICNIWFHKCNNNFSGPMYIYIYARGGTKKKIRVYLEIYI